MAEMAETAETAEAAEAARTAGSAEVPGTADRSEVDCDLLTVGVEEEFLLVDPATGEAAPAVEAVLAEVPDELRGQVQREFQTSQIEIGTPPGLDLAALRHSLGLLRTGLADAAEAAGTRLVAVGTGPVAGPMPPVVENPRFDRMIERYGLVVPSPGVNGMHIHVGVPDPELGVQVLNHLRPALPLLHAATANSPFYAGRDTGYASWRSVLWERWPSVAPTPWLESHAHYERLVAKLIETGMMLDEGMLYWYARLSANYPTVEIRIGDVCPSLDDTILIAALVRALVDTALTDIAAGRPAHPVPHHLLAAAHWRAAHDGLEGLAVDLDGHGLRPAWQLLRRLVNRLRPALERHGDLAVVTALLTRLQAHGTGAARQRAAYARRQEFSDVLDDLIRRTRDTADHG
ncbi:glutamate--cysteine ligase [Plantactinospora sp. B5E13]|uniref:carboxylate-amine ligase n=1 Tax=Plantactinospora sp. B5E13 TaxID=3153758 RepID=UPI00325C5542